jgi:hypothetical protein
MKLLRDIIGYLLGLVLFVGLMPTLMWLASGRPAFLKYPHCLMTFKELSA